ncbi:MAG: tetratricopeptide repeat protein [Thermodesulfobacteriota bacterium]
MEITEEGHFSENGNVKDFFLSKRAGSTREHKVDTELNLMKEPLKFHFSHALTDTPFIEGALSRLEDATRFGVIMIRFDPIDENNHPRKDQEPLIMNIATILEELCRENFSGWGLIEPDMIGCYIKNKTDKECLEAGSRIQAQLSESRKETVSIGVAQFPTLNFSRNQIFENARKAIHHAGFFGPNSRVRFDAVSLNISGDMRYQEGDIPGAIREFQAALMLDPSNVNLHNSLGVCYAGSGEHDRAKECFDAAKWIDPDEAMPIYNLGLLNLIAGNRKEALALFLESEAVEKGIYEVVFQIGRLYFEENDLTRAKNYFEEAAALRPSSGPAYRYLGECCEMMNLRNEAVSAYKKAVKLNPNDAPSLSALGYLFHTMGENPEIAVTFCRQSVQLSPDKGLFRYRLGEIYFRQNRWKEAREELTAAIRLGHEGETLLKEIDIGNESPERC